MGAYTHFTTYLLLFYYIYYLITSYIGYIIIKHSTMKIPCSNIFHKAQKILNVSPCYAQCMRNFKYTPIHMQHVFNKEKNETLRRGRLMCHTYRFDDQKESFVQNNPEIKEEEEDGDDKQASKFHIALRAITFLIGAGLSGFYVYIEYFLKKKNKVRTKGTPDIGMDLDFELVDNRGNKFTG